MKTSLLVRSVQFEAAAGLERLLLLVLGVFLNLNLNLEQDWDLYWEREGKKESFLHLARSKRMNSMLVEATEVARILGLLWIVEAAAHSSNLNLNY